MLFILFKIAQITCQSLRTKNKILKLSAKMLLDKNYIEYVQICC